jgi:quinoprotein glucose dehydrogenase
MTRTVFRTVPAFVILAAALVSIAPRLAGQAGTAAGQPSTKNGEWPLYTADLRGSKYSPLDQINATNFNKLEVAWRFKTDSLGPRPEYKLEGTPLMVKGVLYTTAGTRRSVVSLDAKTGELMWSYSLREGNRAAIAPRAVHHNRLSACGAERPYGAARRLIRQERHRRSQGRRRVRQSPADQPRDG